MTDAAAPRRSSLAIALEMFGPYELYMLVLSVFSIGVLATDTLLSLSESTHQVLGYTDFGLCLLFLVDFVRSLIRAPDRLRYLIRGGWLDLASSIPTIDALRLGRLSRIARIVRLLRAMRSVRTIGTIITHNRKQSALLAAGTVSLLLAVFASLAILQCETHPESNIKTAGDALWWAFATITTVGYGDRYPVTLEGRLVASVLMAVGVGLFGTLAGLAASWFLGSEDEEGPDKVEALTVQVAQLRALVEASLRR
jgi:voltage-gated potassium channel